VDFFRILTLPLAVGRSPTHDVFGFINHQQTGAYEKCNSVAFRADTSVDV
jgi:hypothetical protein